MSENSLRDLTHQLDESSAEVARVRLEASIRLVCRRDYVSSLNLSLDSTGDVGNEWGGTCKKLSDAQVSLIL